MVKILKPSGNRISQVLLVFQITQHNRDEQLMRSLTEFFKAGNTYNNKNRIYFMVTKFDSLTNIIIPFYEKYPIVGVKALDFADFCEVANLMKKGAHLTSEGLEKIKKIKIRMNRGRKEV